MKVITHKFTAESLLERLSDHFGKMLDTMTFKDVVDIVAAIGLTPVIMTAIGDLKPIMSVLGRAVSIVSAPFNAVENPVGAFQLIWSDIVFAFSHPTTVFNPFVGPPSSTSTKTTPATVSSPDLQNIFQILLAFAIAWCIVKWGDKMISAGLGTLEGIVGMLGIALL